MSTETLPVTTNHQAAPAADPAMIARTALEAERDKMKEEMKKTQQYLNDTQQQLVHIQEVLLRQQGAVQVLEGLLAKQETPAA